MGSDYNMRDLLASHIPLGVTEVIPAFSLSQTQVFDRRG